MDDIEKALKALLEALEKANPNATVRVTISVSKKTNKA